MIKPVIVIGGGGHAAVVIDALRQAGATIAGLLDPALEPDSHRHGVTVLGDDEVLAHHHPGDVRLANGLGSVRSTERRAAAFRRLTTLGYEFATLRHPSAVVAESAVLGPGCQVMAGAIVQPGATLAANVLINTAASVDHDCRIGAHVHVAPRAVLSGNVTVEDQVHIGVGAVVVQGITIGAGSLIAAGAVVSADVPKQYVARPARGEIGALAT